MAAQRASWQLGAHPQLLPCCLASPGLASLPPCCHCPTPPPPAGIIYSSQVKDLGDLLTDDEAAEREAAAQGGVPGYCGDR